ncbi:hypothetical protein [Bradyrhizobium sp. 169]|uniref:hypothetical protein n=1 Tax=Bradyrhizobium sp. 169 TaxID=2782640 RepID=UPI001FF905D9|nr:hypothetical protein [Bradyrhizobium sp. 169]MCK1590241.1 hypothetical protein [Bradyrhizobium sp. 169]
MHDDDLLILRRPLNGATVIGSDTGPESGADFHVTSLHRVIWPLASRKKCENFISSLFKWSISVLVVCLRRLSSFALLTAASLQDLDNSPNSVRQPLSVTARIAEQDLRGFGAFENEVRIVAPRNDSSQHISHGL